MTSRFFAGCSVLALMAGGVRAEPVRLVRDLETSAVNRGSFLGGFVVWNGRAYFAASDRRHGLELWSTDGTRQGTRLVRDVSPGPRGAAAPLLGPPPASPPVAGESLLWLVLDDGASGRELWASDGTAAGTRLVADLCPGPCTGRPSRLFPWRDAVSRDSVFFAYRDDARGNELWISDGTRDGTRQVRDICPGPCSSLEERTQLSNLMVELDGFLLFTADDGEHGRELWRSDGTEAGTVRLTDLCPGTCSGVTNARWAVLGGALFFLADPVGRFGFELWKTDGTAAGTARVMDDLGKIYVVGDELLIVSSRSLWRSDGTAHGTFRFAKLPRNVFVFGDAIPLATEAGFRAFFFTARPQRELKADRLWTTDGTRAGTRLLADVEGAQPFGAVAGGRLIFGAGAPPDSEPWVSDGTPAGTHRLKDVQPGESGSYPSLFAALDPSHVLFAAFTAERGLEPMITDGTAAGTRLVKDIDGPDPSSYPTALNVFGDRLFFAAAAADDGTGLWASDGTADGTTLVTGGLRVDELVAAPDRLYFAGGDADAPCQLWTSDGTPEGSVRLLSGEVPSHGLATLGNTLFFFERSGGGQRLWASDGTLAGTRLVADVNPDWREPCFSDYFPRCPYRCPFAYPRALTPAGDRLFFVASDDEHGAELWTSDRAARTERVADLLAGPPSSDPADLTVAGTRLYFSAATAGGRRLWASDGSAAGTTLVSGLSEGTEPRELTALGNRLFFIGSRSSGDSLYVSKTASDRAVRVLKLEVDGEPGFARGLTAVGERLFFAVFTAATGEELWTSDGTAAGTRLVMDAAPGARGSSPQSFAAVDGRLFFAADDGVKGLELWTSDGSAEGTCRLKDVAPGLLPSAPAEVTPLGDRVFFTADGRAVGRELWTLPRQVRCRAR